MQDLYSASFKAATAQASGATAQALARRAIATARKRDCGWYDSSFDLARGLEIVEQDDDALYQLWALSQH